MIRVFHLTVVQSVDFVLQNTSSTFYSETCSKPGAVKSEMLSKASFNAKAYKVCGLMVTKVVSLAMYVVPKSS